MPQEEVKSQLQSTAALVDRWHDAYMEARSLCRPSSPAPWHFFVLSQACAEPERTYPDCTCSASRFGPGPLALCQQVREKIEVEGREPRWEFSKTVLFERSAHISDVCGSLAAAVDTYHSLRQTLGPKLEAMTGSSQLPTPTA